MQSNVRPTTFWTISAGQRMRYVGAIGALAMATAFSFVVPLVIKFAMDAITGVPLPAPLNGVSAFADTVAKALAWQWLTAFLLLCACGVVAATAAAGYFMYLRGKHGAIASEAITRRVREYLYTQLQHLFAHFHDTADTGDLVQRCSSDVETMRVFLSSDIIEIARALLLVIIVTPVLFALHADLAMVSLALIPAIFIAAIVFFRAVKTVFQKQDEAEGEMTTTLQENLTGIRVVRAFARQDYEVAKFATKNARYRDLNNRLIQLMGYFWASTDFLAIGQIGLVLGAGAYFLSTHEITVGTLTACMTCVSMVIWPVRQMGRIITDSGKAVVALGRINFILTHDTEARTLPSGLGRTDGTIEFDHVTFGYDKDKPVIHDLSFSVAAGETLAIVGPPGAGKSTVLRLILRLYDYNSGSIRFGGKELASLDRKYVRAQCSVVMQEPFLYSRTLLENLRVGRRDAADQVVHHATMDAAIHESIMSFPNQYQTLVGERGVTLSGGQRQRVALARALLRDPPILMLDDSLSAVDTGTEKRILEALTRRRGRHTTFIVAHRLTSVMHADRILVLDKGRKLQLGTHAELLAVDGPYRRLCEIQGNLESSIKTDLRNVS